MAQRLLMNAVTKDAAMSHKEFTEEELAACKETDLVQLCNYLGYKTKRVGNYYTIEGMDSIRIKNRRTYTRYSDDTGGSAIDFLVNLEKKDFKEAVRWLLDYHGIYHSSPAYVSRQPDRRRESQSDTKKAAAFDKIAKSIPEEQEPKPFRLPNANYDYDRIYRYLCEERKLSREVVRFFVDRRMIYESVKTHNVVFVGRDAEGIARHASLRGTYNPKNDKPFKGVLPGSNAEYSFNLINPLNDMLVVCEAPIDCMSYMDFTRDLLHQEGEKVLCNNYLALTGTHDRALERFLRDNPHVKEIRLALDTDDPGRKACEKIIEKYTSGEWKKRGFKIMIDPPGEYKDWNEFLIEMHKARIEFECQQAIEKSGSLSEGLKQILQKEHLQFDEVRGVLTDAVDIQNSVNDKANTVKRII